MKKQEDVKFLLSISNNPQFPFNSYIGINYNKKGVKNVKLYFAFYEKLPVELIASYIPLTAHFKTHYAQFKPRKERSLKDTGFCLTYKVDAELRITKGYHFRISARKKPRDRSLKKYEILNIGICEEFSGEKIRRKDYFYFTDENAKKLFARRYKKPYLGLTTLAEFTESEGQEKLISINAANTDLYNRHFNYDFNSAKEILACFRKYRFSSHLVYGIYRDSDTRALYLYDVEKAGSAHPFGLPENFHIHTVKKWLHGRD